MPNDYITLLLIDAAAALLLVGAILIRNPEGAARKHWVPGLAATGLVALLGGADMTFHWPIAGQHAWANVAYGEPMLLLGAIVLAMALAMARGWSLASLGPVAMIAGVALGVMGAKILADGLSNAPAMTAAGFWLSGAAALLSWPAVAGARIKPLRYVVGGLFIVAGLLWAFTGCMSYWSHVKSYPAGT